MLLQVKPRLVTKTKQKEMEKEQNKPNRNFLNIRLCDLHSFLCPFLSFVYAVFLNFFFFRMQFDFKQKETCNKQQNKIPVHFRKKIKSYIFYQLCKQQNFFFFNIQTRGVKVNETKKTKTIKKRRNQFAFYFF